MAHDTAWHAPSPLWNRVLDAGAASPLGFRQPALWRFTGDDFMGELRRTLEQQPENVAGFHARPETWRAPAAGWPDGVTNGGPPLKLYQPSQGRFYLVAASLVCRRTGLPDRAVDAAAEESAAFVVRRLVPAVPGAAVDPQDPATYGEAGWFGDRQAGVWKRVASPGAVEAGEERLALFPLVFQQEGRQRRLLAGFVPAAGAEVYERRASAALPGELAGDPLGDPRLAEFEEGIVPGFEQLADPRGQTGLLEVFLFALLDEVDFLKQHLPGVWDAMEASQPAEPGSLLELLNSSIRTSPPPVVTESWSELLLDVDSRRQSLLEGGDPTVFAAADLSDAEITAAAQKALTGELRERLQTALAEAPPAGAEATEATAPQGLSPEPYYVLRCVYERPRCAKLMPPALSEPTAPFRFSAVFDPDAPARPVRIPLPEDTSLAGLRRFTKQGVQFLVSNSLRQQMAMVDGVDVGDLDDGNLEPPGGDGGSGLGMICSFSIPIITICAFLLLMIIVQLLNIVFWWLPLFRICLPFKK